MIARLWHGVVPKSKADEYLRLMVSVALPDYTGIEGNCGAWCLHRPEGEVVHFEMLTFWDSFEAVRRFAGDPVDAAKYYDFDSDFLMEMEPKVHHYEAYAAPGITAPR